MDQKNKIQAVIFDMDGVISDTQAVMSRIESDFFKEQGIDLSPEEITRRYAGTVSREMFMHAFDLFKKPIKDIDSLIQERRRRIDQAIEGNIFEVPGTRSFIEYLKSENVPIAVASSSRITFIERVLNTLNLRHHFEAIASSEEVPYGKPDPGVFLLAAERLGVPPEFCVVIEDGVHGMVGARRAGMQSIGLVRHGELDRAIYPADVLTRTLENFKFDF